MRLDQANDRLLRIPLIKTAEGDLDYPGRAEIRGTVRSPAHAAPVDIPVVRTININVELSQVKLYLPEDFRWVHFEGTATQVPGRR